MNDAFLCTINLLLHDTTQRPTSDTCVLFTITSGSLHFLACHFFISQHLPSYVHALDRPSVLLHLFFIFYRVVLTWESCLRHAHGLSCIVSSLSLLVFQFSVDAIF